MPLRRIGVAIAGTRRPLRARAHHQRRGRLGVVLVDRLRRRLLDGVGRESRSLRGCLCRLDPHSLGERNLGASVCVKAGAAASGSLQSELRDLSGLAGAMGRVVRTSAFAAGVAFHHIGGCDHPRTADRLGRDRQVGPHPPVHLPGALRPQRSAVRQGHRFLPLLAAGLRRRQELAAVDPPAGHAHGRLNLFPARRHQSGHSALERFIRGNRPWLRAARPLFRDQGLGLRFGSLPPGLQRQRRRRRRRLHRCSCRAAGALTAHRPCRRCGRWRLRQRAAAHGPPRRRSGSAGVRRLACVCRGGPCAVRALLCQAERAAVGDAVYSAQHRSHAGSLQPRRRSR